MIICIDILLFVVFVALYWLYYVHTRVYVFVFLAFGWGHPGPWPWACTAVGGCNYTNVITYYLHMLCSTIHFFICLRISSTNKACKLPIMRIRLGRIGSINFSYVLKRDANPCFSIFWYVSARVDILRCVVIYIAYAYSPRSANEVKTFVPNSTFAQVVQAGHFLHLEDIEQSNAMLNTFVNNISH